MRSFTWFTKLVLATVLCCAVSAPVLAQDVAPANAPFKQETEIKNPDGSQTEIQTRRNADGTGSVTVDRDWGTGTWLAIGLGVALIAGLGFAMTRRDDHFGTPVGGVR